MPSMKASRHLHFWWLLQAAMIVLPVVALAVVAIGFFHEDRAQAEKEARSRATALAKDAAHLLGERATAALAGAKLRQGLIAGGLGYAATDYPLVPAPSDWLQTVSSEQAQHWQAAQDWLFRKPDDVAASHSLDALVAGRPAEAARANAALTQLAIAERHGDGAVLIHQAVTTAHENPSAVTSSGSPVSTLALLVAVRHVTHGNPSDELLSEVERNVTEHPSFFSTDLLDALTAASTTEPARDRASQIQRKWNHDEGERAAVRNAMQHLAARLNYGPIGRPRLLYYAEQGSVRPGTLAFSEPRADGWHVILADPGLLYNALRPTLPRNIGALVSLESGSWRFGTPFSGGRAAALGQATGRFAVNSQEYSFHITIGARDPAALYGPYRRRVNLIRCLICLAALAPLFGLWRLLQVYQEQARLSVMKSNLVSSVSHELRAPIAAVRLMAESLEAGRVSGAGKEKDYYRLIVRECRRISSLVENVLDFSRIDQGRKQYRFEPVDLAGLLRHTVMLMEPAAGERQIRIELSMQEGCETPEPSWDAEAVEQSLVNLLDNAIKHSPSGAEVRVAVEAMPGVIRIWVADQGAGIPEAEHQKIFDLFYRCGSELRRETEGAGIGLSIVKHVAEAHGGKVLVDSAPGRGSRFGLELPRGTEA